MDKSIAEQATGDTALIQMDFSENFTATYQVNGSPIQY